MISRQRNVNGAYAHIVRTFAASTDAYRTTNSRNGPVKEIRTPFITVYERPKERVLFDPVRDCNPFLHLFESLWMLAGRNDLAFLTQFTKTFESFSDDGQTLHGAYGHRWRHWGMWNKDQLDHNIRELKTSPETRRAVTQMWSADTDLGRNGKDVPCNTAVYWKIRDGRLDMTVTNRSNDAIWGAYGANAVHFSMLQEYIAVSVGVPVGIYYQFSDSLHIYPEFPVVKRIFEGPLPEYAACPYELGQVIPQPLLTGGATVDMLNDDLRWFFRMQPEFDDYSTPFFAETVLPMWRTFRRFKAYGAEDALLEVRRIEATDWRRAAHEWLQRRVK